MSIEWKKRQWLQDVTLTLAFKVKSFGVSQWRQVLHLVRYLNG